MSRAVITQEPPQDVSSFTLPPEANTQASRAGWTATMRRPGVLKSIAGGTLAAVAIAGWTLYGIDAAKPDEAPTQAEISASIQAAFTSGFNNATSSYDLRPSSTCPEITTSPLVTSTAPAPTASESSAFIEALKEAGVPEEIINQALSQLFAGNGSAIANSPVTGSATATTFVKMEITPAPALPTQTADQGPAGST